MAKRGFNKELGESLHIDKVYRPRSLFERVSNRKLLILRLKSLPCLAVACATAKALATRGYAKAGNLKLNQVAEKTSLRRFINM